MPGLRRAASRLALAFGAAAIAVGCLVPTFALRTEVSSPDADLLVRQYVVASVVGLAFADDPDSLQVGDTYVEPGADAPTWPARAVLATALAAIGLVAVGRRRAALIACAALALAVAWLFVELGPPSAAAATAPRAAGWTAYPPMSAGEPAAAPLPFPGDWSGWIALAAGTLLLGVSAALAPARGARPAP